MLDTVVVADAAADAGRADSQPIGGCGGVAWRGVLGVCGGIFQALCSGLFLLLCSLIRSDHSRIPLHRGRFPLMIETVSLEKAEEPPKTEP